MSEGGADLELYPAGSDDDLRIGDRVRFVTPYRFTFHKREPWVGGQYLYGKDGQPVMVTEPRYFEGVIVDRRQDARTGQWMYQVRRSDDTRSVCWYGREMVELL